MNTIGTRKQCAITVKIISDKSGLGRKLNQHVYDKIFTEAYRRIMERKNKLIKN